MYIETPPLTSVETVILVVIHVPQLVSVLPVIQAIAINISMVILLDSVSKIAPTMLMDNSHKHRPLLTLAIHAPQIVRPVPLAQLATAQNVILITSSMVIVVVLIKTSVYLVVHQLVNLLQLLAQ